MHPAHVGRLVSAKGRAEMRKGERSSLAAAHLLRARQPIREKRRTAIKKLVERTRGNLFDVDDEGTLRELPPPPPPLPPSFFSAPGANPPCKRAEVGNKDQSNSNPFHLPLSPSLSLRQFVHTAENDQIIQGKVSVKLAKNISFVYSSGKMVDLLGRGFWD